MSNKGSKNQKSRQKVLEYQNSSKFKRIPDSDPQSEKTRVPGRDSRFENSPNYKKFPELHE